MIATCATIAAALAAAQGGETVNLKGDCPTITIERVYQRQVTVNAGGATVRGLVITGGNIRWRSGRIVAPQGAFGFARGGYGVTLTPTAQRVTFDGVTITDAKKGIVLDGGKDVTITRSRFTRLGEDGVIASRTQGLRIIANRFENTVGRPTSCTIGVDVTYGLPKRDCAGQWVDGTHADAVQMRNGITDALIERNIIRGPTQGIAQMDTTGDAPLSRVTILGNDIQTSQPHRITLTACTDCRIERNQVRGEPGSKYRAVIIAGPARRCGNDAPEDRVVDSPCV